MPDAFFRREDVKDWAMIKILRWFVVGAFALTVGSPQAALFDRGNGLVYDDDLDITWSNSFGGAMTWSDAQAWIISLNSSNTGIGYLGFNDWRLPKSDNCLGYSCRDSEMAHLFYTELGGYANTAISQRHNSNYALFPDLLDQQYWSSTTYAPDTSHAYFFYFNLGLTNALPKSSLGIHAWAVRDGDVAPPSAVPEPETNLLMLTGLTALYLASRRKKMVKTSA